MSWTVPEAASDSHNAGDSRRMIKYLLIVLIIIDGILCLIYFFGSGVEKPTFWEYLGSDQFALGTTGLIIPIIIAFVDENFEIRKSLRERIQKRQEAKREQAQKERETKHNQRFQCIDTTTNTWKQLFELVTEVEYADTGEKIKEYVKKIENFSDSAGSTVNLLYFHYSDLLTINDINLFVKAINFLLCSTATTANSILGIFTSTKDPKENLSPKITPFADRLEMIQNLVRRVFYHPFLQMLESADEILTETSKEVEDDIKQLSNKLATYKKAIELLGVINNEKEIPPIKQEKKKPIDILATNIKIMKTWISEFNGIIENHTKLEALRKPAEFLGDENLIPLSKLHRGDSRNDLTKFKEVCKTQEWNFDKRVSALKVTYSEECVCKLAQWASYERVAQGLRQLPKKNPDEAPKKPPEVELKCKAEEKSERKPEEKPSVKPEESANGP